MDNAPARRARVKLVARPQLFREPLAPELPQGKSEPETGPAP
jgi:hypothetical protein